MKNKVLTILVAGALFIGCGGSGTTGTTQEGIGAGTYVDSAVDGAKYVCGNQSGTTGDTGTKGGFKYEKGEPCTFSINGIELSKVLGDKLNADKVEIKVGDTDVAIFLQSLDMDGNATNGITIDPKVVEALSENGTASLPTTPAEVQAIVSLLSSKGIGYSGKAIAKNDAQMHMAGFSLFMSVIPGPYFEGEEIRFAADVAGNTDGLTYEWVGLDGTSSSFTTSDLASGEQIIVVKVTKGDITLSASQTIEITEAGGFAVTITGGQSNYNTTDDVTLEANITGNVGNNPIYAWKDGSTPLATSKIMTQKFAAGSHFVTVDVTENEITKSASFDFNVSDLTDFNISGSTIGQISTGLMWVNSDESEGACLAIHGDEYNASKGYDDSFERAKTFCNVLTLSGFTNWRTPDTDEISDYIKETSAANIITKYDRPCTQLLALVKNADAADGVNYRAVTTRFMSTDYFSIGSVRTHTYAADVANLLKYNIGLRCVRNVDGSGGEDIPGVNISVSITGAKASYTVDEDVNLTANVTNATTISYVWKEGTVELGRLRTLLKSDFPTGPHTVTLLVTADDINKSKSVTFNVVNAPDLTDFNITSLTANNDEVIIHAGLMWVNESNVTKDKCAKIHGNDANHTVRFETEFTRAKTFCSTAPFGNFAGLSGWRTPTKSELTTFIEESVASNIDVWYDAPCKKLLALKNAGDNIDNNDSYTTVSTIHDTTKTPGTESNMIPNIGLRCVRTH